MLRSFTPTGPLPLSTVWILFPEGLREIGGAIASAFWVLVRPGRHGLFAPTFLQPLAFGSEAERNARKIRVRDEVTANPPRIFV